MYSQRLDLYRIFLTAADAASYTEAGRSLFMTQSAVSQSIRQLENALGTQLFYRAGRGMALTQEGEALVRHLKTAFAQIRLGEQALDAMRNLEEGQLRIAASDTLCRHYLLPLLQRLNQKHPALRVRIINRPSPACLQLVAEAAVDLAFVNRSPYAPPPGVRLEDVLTYQDCFMAPHEKETAPVPLGQVLNMPLIVLEPGSSTRENLETWSESQGLPLQPAIEVGSVDLILDLVRIGLGVGWIPGYALPAAQSAGLHRLPTHEASPMRAVALAALETAPETRAAVAFRELVTGNGLNDG